ncbi:hypothetical protein JCM10213_006674 [Rhodosporidiobolus nylandii]
MTALHTPAPPPAPTKPSLHLSLSPSPSSAAAPSTPSSLSTSSQAHLGHGRGPSSTSTSSSGGRHSWQSPSFPSASPSSHSHSFTSASRRVASWGSSTSETHHALNALGDDNHLAGLPSPLDFDREREGRREFGFLPASSSFSSAAGTGGGGGGGGQSTGGSEWYGSWGRTGGRGRASSIFEELRGGGGESGGRSGSGWTDYGTGGSAVDTPTRGGGGGVTEDGRKNPERSKTLSFFDSASQSSSAGRNGALSPPPNPPSRQNSLSSSSYRGGGGNGHQRERSGSSASGWGGAATVGGWGAFPAASSSPVPPPPLPLQLPPPKTEKEKKDARALRTSTASSSGGGGGGGASWLDEAADEAAEKTGSGLWTRGRGGSIGSVKSIGARRDGSPGRYTYAPPPPPVLPPQPPPQEQARPRLPALNTSVADELGGLSLASATSSPSHRPLSSLPTAVDPPFAVSPSSSASAARAARFLNFSSPSPASSPSTSHRPPTTAPPVPQTRVQRPFPVPSGATTPLGEPATPQRKERASKSSSSFSTATATPSASHPHPPRSEHERRPDAEVGDGEGAEKEELEDDGPPLPLRGDRIGEYTVERVLGKGAFSRVALARPRRERAGGKDAAGGGGEGLVALKLVARSACEGNERMRISVLREVEVLKNIQHPSLVSLSSTFTTPLYTALVLDFCPGGELFDFLAEWHSQVSKALARHIFGELASAVGWMHEIGLVHRDIKLENILLTARPFPCADPSSVLATLPSPFIKLTDFGLSRFINPSSPLLSTRCGSEAYAAPELIMGKKYDGRCTDAWALGVVLFAVITGVMPFVEEPGAGARGRRAYLLRIAKADYRWPGQQGSSRLSLSTTSTPSSSPTKPQSSHTPSSSISSIGTNGVASPPLPAAAPPSARLVTPPVQALVSRLLVRDPAKRARVDEVWDSEWMSGEGRPVRQRGVMRRREEGKRPGRGAAGAEDEGWARRGSELLES